MASLRIRKRSDGTNAFTVLWRVGGTQTSMTFPARRDAENFRRAIDATGGDLADANRMLHAANGPVPSLLAVAELHITGLASVSDRTRADYRRQVARHITPTLGALPVDEITPQHIRDWLNDLAASDLADKSITGFHGLLSAIMGTATELGHRDDNPCRGMRMPRRLQHKKVQRQFLTAAEWWAIDDALGEVAGGHYRTAFRTLAGTGMRLGEMAGLQVNDLSLTSDPPTISISRALTRTAEGGMKLGPTKTSHSVRTVSIDDALAADLAEHIRTTSPGRGQLFTSQQGQMIHQHHILARVWKPAVALSGIAKQPRIHDLRHSHASWLIAAGVDLMTVQRRLGHESITTTTSVYGHLLPGQQRAAADAIGAIMKRA